MMKHFMHGVHIHTWQLRIAMTVYTTTMNFIMYIHVHICSYLLKFSTYLILVKLAINMRWRHP